MKLDKVNAFLLSLPYANESADGYNIMCRCPFCGDSTKNYNSTHFSIKVNVNDKEPLLYQCFQPEYRCGAKGLLTTETLTKLGCNEISTMLELAEYNKTVSAKIDKFTKKYKKDLVIFNISNKLNKAKYAYIERRLGIKLNSDLLKELKIQLTLYDYLKINSIHKLAYNEKYCNLLNDNTIGFISTYDDYIIFRDISKNRVMDKRYINYRIRGEPNIDDMKIYTIPTAIDLLHSKPTIINIAEGVFSLLGVYFNTEFDTKNKYRNEIYSANCGTGYYTTIMHLCRQYGLTKVIINIFSDSEVPVKNYEKIYKRLNDNTSISKFNIYYNTRKEDFGYDRGNIEPTCITLK